MYIKILDRKASLWFFSRCKTTPFHFPKLSKDIIQTAIPVVCHKYIYIEDGMSCHQFNIRKIKFSSHIYSNGVVDFCLKYQASLVVPLLAIKCVMRVRSWIFCSPVRILDKHLYKQFPSAFIHSFPMAHIS